jgi:hypothetical protein
MANRRPSDPPCLHDDLTFQTGYLHGMALRPETSATDYEVLVAVGAYLHACQIQDTLTLTGVTPGPDAPEPEPLADLLLLIDPGNGTGLFWIHGYRGSEEGCVWHFEVGEEAVIPAAWRVVRWFALPEPE